MLLQNKKVIFAITNCIYRFENILIQMEEMIKQGAIITPILSFNAWKNPEITKYKEEIENLTKNKILSEEKEINKVENDIMIIAPCSGNTIGKLAGGIQDTPVLNAAKANLKRENNIVLGISTNDGLSSSAENIGKLLNRKKHYFVPFRQDNPITKPNSLRMEDKYILTTLQEALDERQIQPLLL